MTNIKIKMNFEKALKQADDLEEIAEEIETLAKSDMTDCLNSVSKDWTGENSNKYVKKGTKVVEDIKKTATNLKKVAVTIREAVKKDMQAEEEAERIATERTYSS